jgi:hypothetical protein
VFFLLLALTLGVSLLTAGIVVLGFRSPIRQILQRVIGESIADGWQRFITFALFVIGVSAGVQIWKLEQYLQPPNPGDPKARALTLDGPALALEVYRTIILVLQGLAWALLVFFVAALIAFAVVRRGEMKSAPPPAA